MPVYLFYRTDKDNFEIIILIIFSYTTDRYKYLYNNVIIWV